MTEFNVISTQKSKQFLGEFHGLKVVFTLS